MKRRQFMQCCSAGAATLACASSALAIPIRGRLVDDPETWLGHTFHLLDGTSMMLTDVVDCSCERHALQLRMQFKVVVGLPPLEGMHSIFNGLEHESLFLQPGAVGPVAWLNRLRHSA